MKSLLKLSGISLIALALAVSCGEKGSKVELKDIRDSASYGIGLSIATNLAQDKLDSLNLDALVAGYLDAKKEDKKIALDSINFIIQKYAESEMKKQNAPIIAAGKKFLDTNKKKPTVKTTASGLQYEVISMGNGTKPAIYDSVTVHYHGTKIDGTVFDSSKGGSPVTFPLLPGSLIQGWIEGLQLFPAGTKFKLYVPENLAYGMTGNKVIKPFETLVFEIEIVSVKKGAAPQMDMRALQQMQQMQGMQ